MDLPVNPVTGMIAEILRLKREYRELGTKKSQTFCRLHDTIQQLEWKIKYDLELDDAQREAGQNVLSLVK